MPIIISIEANIGCGKTTLLDNLENSGLFDEKVMFLREPVDVWEKIKDKKTGQTMLSKFYENSDKYSFPFQIMAYTTRLNLLKTMIENNPHVEIFICERSLNCDKEIFAKMLHEDGKIEDMLYEIYLNIFETTACFKMDGVVYLHAEPSICAERIAKRNREGENNISLEYLERCQKYHDDWLDNNDQFPILKIDANGVLNENIANEIQQFVIDLLIKKIDENGFQKLYEFVTDLFVKAKTLF